jgi:hypothetical protein
MRPTRIVPDINISFWRITERVISSTTFTPTGFLKRIGTSVAIVM